MKPNLSMRQEPVVNSEAVPTAVKAGATRIFDRLVTLDDEGVIELQKFVGDRLHAWPQTVAFMKSGELWEATLI